MRLGMFMMPLHHPDKDYAVALAEDREAVILADKLGFSDCWIGEHFTSKAEQITSPLIFLATVIPETERIRLGTGVVNMPQHHPAMVAGNAAMFDQLSGGRLMLGIGSGGLASDFELFDRTDAAARAEMMTESIDAILKIWAEDPPFRFAGKYWDFGVENVVMPEIGVGLFAKPLQQPHPPIAVSVMSPGSNSARLAGARGWIPLSANFLQAIHLPSHWQAYAEGAEAAGRRPERAFWNVARSVLVAETDSEAEDYLANPASGVAFYFEYLKRLLGLRGAATAFKGDPNMADEDVTVPYCIDSMVISGSPDTVLDKLVALCDQTGDFGTLVMTAHDWDDKALWRRSMALLANDVMPRFSRHAAQAAE